MDKTEHDVQWENLLYKCGITRHWINTGIWYNINTKRNWRDSIIHNIDTLRGYPPFTLDTFYEYIIPMVGKNGWLVRLQYNPKDYPTKPDTKWHYFVELHDVTHKKERLFHNFNHPYFGDSPVELLLIACTKALEDIPIMKDGESING